MRHENWIRFCFKIVSKSKSENYKHVSVLVRSGRIIAIGYNRNDRRGALKFSFYDSIKDGWHSELDALYKFDPEEVKDAILYTVGINGKNGNIVFGCPCKQCQELLRLYKLKAVYYADRSGKPQKLILEGIN